MRNKAIVVIIVFGIVTILLYLFLSLKKSHDTDSLTRGPTEVREGKKLAQTYCITCHMVPSPTIVSKKTWPKILGWMGMYLGFIPIEAKTESINFIFLRKGEDSFADFLSDRRKDLERLNLIPQKPVISNSQWAKINAYYQYFSPTNVEPLTEKPQLSTNLKLFTVLTTDYQPTVPATTLLKIDGNKQKIILGDHRSQRLTFVSSKGKIEKSIKTGGTPVSFKSSKDGFYLTLMGSFIPTDRKLGQVVHYEKGEQNAVYKKIVILEGLYRNTHTQFSDLNQDGLEDIVVSGFGYNIGSFSWFENKGSRGYKEHVLIDRPGALNSEIVDLNRDGKPDIVVLMAQAKEGVYFFENQGEGVFKERNLIKEHPGFGFVQMKLVDFNDDNYLDIITANGDNWDMPGEKPLKSFHGLRIYLNDGKNRFKERYFYPMHGAYGVIPADFDLDGDVDLAGIAFFPDLSQELKETFVYLENTGDFNFKAYTLKKDYSGLWIVMAGGDVDNDADIDIALGGAYFGQDKWPEVPRPLLLLLNQTR